jgi:hypothetical protein
MAWNKLFYDITIYKNYFIKNMNLKREIRLQFWMRIMLEIDRYMAGNENKKCRKL